MKLKKTTKKALLEASIGYRNREAIHKLVNLTQFQDNPHLFNRKDPEIPKVETTLPKFSIRRLLINLKV